MRMRTIAILISLLSRGFLCLHSPAQLQSDKEEDVTAAHRWSQGNPLRYQYSTYSDRYVDHKNLQSYQAPFGWLCPCAGKSDKTRRHLVSCG
ncbi:hypothetical protein C8R48DRAFT_738667, partial [Suillus tomentosus]